MMRKKLTRGLVGGVIAVALIFLFTLSIYIPAVGAKEKPIKFGSDCGYSGVCFMYCVSSLKGVRLAMEEINAAGGILERPITLVTRDSELKVSTGVRELKDLILRDKVDFILGDCSSGVCLAFLPILQEYNKMMIHFICNTEAITVEKHVPYAIQMVPNTYMEGRGQARMRAEQPYKKYCYIGPDYDFGHREFQAFKEEMGRLRPDVKIIKEFWPKLGEKDFTSYITAILATDAEAVQSSHYGGDLVAFVKQAKPYGFFDKVAYASLFDVDVLAELGDECPEGLTAYCRAPFFGEKTEKMAEFVENYRKAYGEYPSDWAVMGYDSMYMYKKIIEKAGTTDTAAVMKASEGIELDSLRGPISVRAIDHMASVPVYEGITAKDPNYPFLTYKDLRRIPGEEVWRAEEDIPKIRK
jgi:branched-chain amino acid transport system substrate-binding protein